MHHDIAASTLLAALAAVLVLRRRRPSPATSPTTGGRPSESGWGVSVTQQGNIAFVVMLRLRTRRRADVALRRCARATARTCGGHPGIRGTALSHDRPVARRPVRSGARSTAAPVGEHHVRGQRTSTARTLSVLRRRRATSTKTVQRLTFRNKDWSRHSTAAWTRANYRDCAPTFVPAFSVRRRPDRRRARRQRVPHVVRRQEGGVHVHRHVYAARPRRQA